MPIIAILWQYRTQIMYFVLISLAVFVIWWFGFHVPKVNEERRQEIIELNKQIKSRDNAINLLGAIGAAHAQAEKQYEDNLRRIRAGHKPSRTGIFVLGGVLPAVFTGYSSAGGAATTDDAGTVRPEGAILPNR
jgi:hypothetical protein